MYMAGLGADKKPDSSLNISDWSEKLKLDIQCYNTEGCVFVFFFAK